MHRNKQAIKFSHLGGLRVGTYAFFIGAFFALITSMLSPLQASALNYAEPINAKWIDSATINISGQLNPRQTYSANFVDSNPNDLTQEFLHSEGNGCFSKITIAGNVSFGTFVNTSALMKSGPGGKGSIFDKCQSDSPINIALTDTNKAQTTPTPSNSSVVSYAGTTYTWIDKSTIKLSGTVNDTFVLKNSVYERQKDPDASCPDTISGVTADNKTATLNVSTSTARACTASSSTRITFVASSVSNATKAAAASTADVVPCSGNIPVFGWAICWIAEQADSILQTLEASINSLLSVPPESYGEGESENASGVNGLKTAWSSVRIIASLLLVGVALIMVLSQIFSLEFVSAYTVKKVLPKLVIATILIQLSWVLFTGFIQVVDAISFALRDLLLAPFGGIENVNISSIFSAYYTNNGAGGTVASFYGLAAIASTAGIAAIGGGFGLFAAAIGVILAIMTAFVTLVIRKIIIIVLLVLSPLALVAWILPNTQKLWSTWWQLFSKLTLMFPLVVLLLTSGKIFAYLTAQQNTGGWIAFYIIIVAYFGPLFLIPATFKFAGSLFSKVGGVLNGASNRVKGSQTGFMGRVNAGKKNNIQAREYNRKRAGIERAQSGSWAGKRIGRFNAGTAGARGAYADQVRESEKQEAVKNAGLELRAITEGQDYRQRMSDLTKLATATDGAKVSVNGRNVVASRALRRSAASTLADNGDVDNLNLLRDSLIGSKRGSEWNAIADENAGSLLKSDPTLMGKKITDLGSEQLATVKPQTLRRGRQSLAGATRNEQIAARERAKETLSTPDIAAKLSSESRSELEKIAVEDFQSRATTTISAKDASGRTVATETVEVDFAGRTNRVVSGDKIVDNPTYGRSASANAGDPGSSTNPAPRLF